MAETPVPMVLVDGDKRLDSPNPAAQLFLRERAAALRARRTYDLLPTALHRQFDDRWATMLGNGAVAGTVVLRTPDARAVTLHYRCVAQILPGLTLVVGMPTHLAIGDLIGEFQAPRQTCAGRLRPREKQILTLLGLGCTLDEVAQDLTLSIETVRTHVRNAIRRLGARNRTHAFALAIRAGEIDLD